MKLSYKTLVFVLSFLVLASGITFAFSGDESRMVYRSANADFGEELLVPGWEYGDLVARTGTNYVLATNDGSQLIGVVSATTAFIGNAVPEPTPDHAVVGYLGIVLTSVSTENGTIAAGDPIGASSQPGIGMKMTSSGYIVGRALGDFTSGTTCGAYQCGQVEVQVIPSWFDPYILAAGGTTSYMASLNGLADSDQLFATATSGTDFSINSASGTHTFSIPDASITARGLLTSSDWTTFNNKLSNIFTTKGDLLTFSTTPERLGVGADGQVLTADSTTPTGLKWATATGGGTGTVTSVGFATGTTGTDVNVSGSPITTSGTITLNIPDASATARGLITTGTQQVAGNKTFGNNLATNGNFTVGNAAADQMTVNAATVTFANDTAVTLTGGTNGINFDANTLSIDATNNRIGIGTATPAGSLDVTGTVFMNGLTAVAGAGPKVVCYNTTTGELLKSGSASSCSTSSLRFKHDVANIEDGLSFVKVLRPVSFTYNGTDERSLGFVAEEVATLDPRLVYTDAKGVVTGVEYERFIPILTKAIQELSQRFDVLRSDIASWLGAKDNGIERVQVEELCVGDTCIDEATLQMVLETIQKTQ